MFPLARAVAAQAGRLSIPAILLQGLTGLLMLAAVLLMMATTWHPVLAGTVFLLGTLLDHAARELARSRGPASDARSSALAALRYISYGAFFSAAGVRLYTVTGAWTYIYTVTLMVFTWGYLTLLLSRHAREPAGMLDPANLLERGRTGTRVERLIGSLRGLAGSDTFPFLVFAVTAAGLAGLLFWGGLVSSICVVAALVVILRRQDSASGRTAFRNAVTFLLYLAGVLIILVLVSRLPFSDVVEALQVVGPDAAWLLLVPVTWVIPDAITLRILLGNRIQLQEALYAQVSGDAFNSITPVIGVGGEPYKAKYLSNFVPLDDSSHAILQSRLIHALSGVLFTAIVLIISLFMVDLSGIPGLSAGLAAVAALMLVVFVLLLWVTMSKVPSRVTGYVLSKFRLIEEFRHYRLAWPTLWLTMAYKMVGRGGKFLELYLIFLVLDIFPHFADVVLVEALLMASVSLFFFIPQGMGVNEAGIVTAFTILGYSAAAGVAYGLLRRARMLAYTLFGLMVYLLVALNDFRKSRLEVQEVRSEE